MKIGLISPVQFRGTQQSPGEIRTNVLKVCRNLSMDVDFRPIPDNTSVTARTASSTNLITTFDLLLSTNEGQSLIQHHGV